MLTPPLRLRRLAESPVARMDLAGRLLVRGHLGRARHELYAALSANPELAQAHLCLGLIDVLNGNIAEGIPSLDIAVRLDPKLWAGWMMLAEAFLLSATPEDALHAAREAASVSRSPDDLAGALLSQGAAHESMGKTEAAIEAYEKAAGRMDTSGLAHEALARVLASTGEYGHAADAAGKAQRRRPFASESRLLRANLLANRGQSTEALQEYVRGTVQSLHGRAAAAAAKLLADNDLWWEALSIQRIGIMLEPGQVAPWLEMARYYRELDQVAEAIAACKAALAISADDKDAGKLMAELKSLCAPQPTEPDDTSL